MEPEQKPASSSNEPTDDANSTDDATTQMDDTTSTDDDTSVESTDVDDTDTPEDSEEEDDPQDDILPADEADDDTTVPEEPTPKADSDAESEPKLTNPEDVADALGTPHEDETAPDDEPADAADSDDDTSEDEASSEDDSAAPETSVISTPPTVPAAVDAPSDKVEEDADPEETKQDADADEQTEPESVAAASESKDPEAKATSVSPSVDDTDSTPTPGSVVGASAVVVGAPKKTKKPMLIGVVIAAIILVLLGGGAAAYYMVSTKPQNVLNTALVNSFDGNTTSQTFDGSLGVSGGGKSYTSTFSGGANRSGSFTINGTLDTTAGKVGFNMLSPDGSSFYLKATGLDAVANLLKDGPDQTAALYAPFINDFNDQWIEVTQGMVQQLTGTSSTMTSKLTSADMKQLGTYYKQNSFVSYQKSLADQTVAGKDSYQYQVTINKTKLQAFLSEAKNIKDLGITQSDLSSINSYMNKANLTNYPVTVWISKSDKLIDQLAFSTVYNKTTINARYTIDSINNPVAVTAPTDAKSLVNIITGLLSNTSLDSEQALATNDSISL